MNASLLTLTDATPSHFAAIVAIERELGSGSVVALTEGLALDEAVHRGHYLTVALSDDDVAGWIWFHVEIGRDGEEVGHVFRLSVARANRRCGVGRTLVEYARETLKQRGCTKMRTTVDGADEAARAFFEQTGFTIDAVVMERAL